MTYNKCFQKIQFATFTTWVIQLFVEFPVHSLPPVYPKKSLESVSQWHKFTLSRFQLTPQHLSHSEMLTKMSNLTFSKQAGSRKWASGDDNEILLLLSLSKVGRVHLADLLNYPSCSEHHSLPSASVSNPSISLQEYAALRYITLDYHASYFQNIIVFAFRTTFLSIHTIKTAASSATEILCVQ